MSVCNIYEGYYVSMELKGLFELMNPEDLYDYINLQMPCALTYLDIDGRRCVYFIYHNTKSMNYNSFCDHINNKFMHTKVMIVPIKTSDIFIKNEAVFVDNIYDIISETYKFITKVIVFKSDKYIDNMLKEIDKKNTNK
ncbi:MAG: hypothetical protein KDH96_06965 [Candidatus Riesia sp.]|nr:hypothetical protein [Candidatus Riesia sp.]